MDFLSEPSIWVYLFVFFGKIIEVTVSTVRLVLINRGERLKGSITAFFEVSLWLIVTGTVLVGFQEDIFRCFVFALAFAIGNYFGSWLEGKLAFGLCSINVIVSEQNKAEGLAKELRDNNFAVTVIEGEGKQGRREILILHLKRKRIPNAISIIKAKLKDAMITVNDVRIVNGGYIKK
ncbi:MAG: DUF5698 domain-containing protein [Eubacteriales bacterium]|nr:DUF5698 domain-containing protein [Eubacteriales bacterium]